VCIAITICLLLVGCSGGSPKNDEFPFTALPYERTDDVADTIGKSLINVPVWTLEIGLVVAYIYAWATTGSIGGDSWISEEVPGGLVRLATREAAGVNVRHLETDSV
jgi:hypothetical protein